MSSFDLDQDFIEYNTNTILDDQWQNDKINSSPYETTEWDHQDELEDEFDELEDDENEVARPSFIGTTIANRFILGQPLGEPGFTGFVNSGKLKIENNSKKSIQFFNLLIFI